MPTTLGFDSDVILNDPLDREFRASQANAFQELGAQIQQGIKRIQTNRDVAALGEELQSLNPQSMQFPLQAAEVMMRHPMAIQDPRGKTAFELLGASHKQYVSDRFEIEDRARWQQAVGGNAFSALTEPQRELLRATPPSRGAALAADMLDTSNVPPGTAPVMRMPAGFRQEVDGTIVEESTGNRFEVGAGNTLVPAKKRPERVAPFVDASGNPISMTASGEYRDVSGNVIAPDKVFRVPGYFEGARIEESAKGREATEDYRKQTQTLARESKAAMMMQREAMQIEKELKELPAPQWPYQKDDGKYASNITGRALDKAGFDAEFAEQQKIADARVRKEARLKEIGSRLESFEQAVTTAESEGRALMPLMPEYAEKLKRITDPVKRKEALRRLSDGGFDVSAYQ